MIQRLVGLAAIAALVLVAYQASARTHRMAPWVRPKSSPPHGVRRHHQLPVSEGEALVGRPHDGIRALPAEERPPA
ncbi:MAG: hypothetical protein GIX03_05035 [Candidatus Eremiobacteraeota bacterium]|nr:hypothetical protein [Candidatus Eremiobacteraeota bacterium]